MAGNVTSELPFEHMKVMHQRFDRLEHILREQGAAAAEDRAHTRLVMQTTGRHEDTLSAMQMRLARIERRLELHD